MKISHGEQQAIAEAIKLGEVYGFGNLIFHLQTAWARRLVATHGMDEATARQVAGGDGYPFSMQDDLVNFGQWDETGERYK